ncbi:MAG: tol-pal system protein [Beijerinckiaceae bacterium]|nr:MAG: tol-pal system protein [Beijerinckiaceae bacterium]
MVRMIRFSRAAFTLIALFVGAMQCVTIARAQDAADFILRLDRLEAENRRLTGQVDELKFQLRRLEDQIKRFQTDSDTRFRDLEGNRGGIRPAPNAGQPVPGPVTPQKRSDAFDPATSNTAPGAPRPLGSTGVATPPGAPLSAGTLPPGGRLVQDGELGAPLDVSGQRRPPVPPPVTDMPRGDAKSDFDFAKSLVDRGDYELAEGAFKDYMRTYPKDRRVPDATFWLGESYLRRTRYREAAEHFLTVTSKYSNVPRAPEAMLKLGISLRGLGAIQEACGTFAQVGKKYPNASAAIKQAVERERGRAQC